MVNMIASKTGEGPTPFRPRLTNILELLRMVSTRISEIEAKLVNRPPTQKPAAQTDPQTFDDLIHEIDRVSDEVNTGVINLHNFF